MVNGYLVGGLDFFSYIGNGKSSQLTNSLHHFSEGFVETTNQSL